MKKAPLLFVVMALLATVAACQAAQPAATRVPPAVPSVTAESGPHSTLALEVIGANGTTQVLSMEDIKKLPAVEGWGGIKNSAGKITPPERYKGVTIAELCKLVGGLGPDQAVNVVAKDGYAMTFSYDQAVAANVITYDPGTGSEVKISEPLQMVVAYEREGQPLPEESDGTFRICALSSKNNQVIDGHWTVKWVRQMVIKSAAEEWTLHLEGAMVEEMDRATFQSGATPNCHRETWVDADGHTWAGIPLWYLVGRVDDEKRHETRAFDDRAAEAGYAIDIVAADGYSVTLTSQRMMFKDDMIVAIEMDGKPLEDKYFPLRLVGVGLEKKEMIGQIAQIILHLPAQAPSGAPTAAPTTAAGIPVPSAGAALTITGKVEKEVVLTLADLNPMEVEVTAEHPKKGTQTYHGARLNDVLKKVTLGADAKSLVLTASDGYATEVALADVQKCGDCILASTDAGKLDAVMPGMQSSAWTKDVIRVEVK